MTAIFLSEVLYGQDKILEQCQAASYKTACTGVWWQVKWNPEELVSYEGTAYVPVDYRFGFKATYTIRR